MWRRRSGTAVPWSNRLRIQLSATPSLSRRRRSRAVTTRSRPAFFPMLRSRMGARRMTPMICSVSKGGSGDACRGAQPIGEAPGPPASHWWDLSAQPRAGDQLLWLKALRTLDRRRPGPGRWLRDVRTRLRLAVGRCRRRSGRSLGQIFEGYGVMLVSLASYRSARKARRKRCCCQS